MFFVEKPAFLLEWCANRIYRGNVYDIIFLLLHFQFLIRIGCSLVMKSCICPKKNNNKKKLPQMMLYMIRNILDHSAERRPVLKSIHTNITIYHNLRQNLWGEVCGPVRRRKMISTMIFLQCEKQYMNFAK